MHCKKFDVESRRLNFESGLNGARAVNYEEVMKYPVEFEESFVDICLKGIPKKFHSSLTRDGPFIFRFKQRLFQQGTYGCPKETLPPH